MKFNISDRMAAMQPSAIREILKNTTNPDVIPFAAGNPSADAFPVKELENITRIIFGGQPIAALQYSVSEGDPHLRKSVAQFVESREPGLMKDHDQILITTGAQQGIDLTAKCLLNEGDVVLCENPSFVGALNTLRSYNPKLVGIPMEEDGINLAALEQALQTQQRVKLLYLIPNFQNPTGITMSLQKRKAVYQLAKTYGVLILEDNPYGDLRFEGEHIPAIKTLDTEGLVVYCGSFSKIISPGLRVAYTIAHQELMTKLVVAKQCNDVHTSTLSQMLCDQYLSSCNMDAHLANLQKIYRAKSSLMLDAMEEAFGDKISYLRPQGGLFVWCTLPQGVDMLAFIQAALAQKVAVVPGSAFLTDPSAPCSSFRMNFSTPTNKQITDGIEILGQVLRDFVR